LKHTQNNTEEKKADMSLYSVKSSHRKRISKLAHIHIMTILMNIASQQTCRIPNGTTVKLFAGCEVCRKDALLKV